MKVEEEMAQAMKTNNNRGKSIYDVSFLSSVPKLISELSSDKANINWIWEGYLAKGHLTFFSALWKVGKSTLVSYLLRSIQSGNNFAGQKVNPTKTLILSEESESIWVRRREDLGLEGEIYISCRPVKAKLSHQEWITFIDVNVRFCVEKGIEFIIIDTISTFWPVRDEGNNPELDSAIIPLNAFLEKDIAVMLIHHFRKSGGTEGTATRGGGGLGSRADILLEFTRLNADNINSTERVLRSYSRFEETPPELVIELIDGEYLPRGTRSEVSKEAKLQHVLAILKEQDNLTTTDILNAWDADLYGSKPVVRSIRNYIDSLLAGGRVIQSSNKLVGKKDTPTYSLNNSGKESVSLNRISVVDSDSKDIKEDVFLESEVEPIT